MASKRKKPKVARKIPPHIEALFYKPPCDSYLADDFEHWPEYCGCIALAANIRALKAACGTTGAIGLGEEYAENGEITEEVRAAWKRQQAEYDEAYTREPVKT
jgi:hypothetical protein